MSSRYQIRVYESRERDGATDAGTVVLPIERNFTIYAESAEEAERLIRRDIANRKLARGKVYQICPLLGNPELTRALAVADDGSVSRVFLDPADGPFGELRRLRSFQALSAALGDTTNIEADRVETLADILRA